jgi:2-polyprenyl-6-methoxyphenol hydroxylase-like FAD-dependent oxidoreductase
MQDRNGWDALLKERNELITMMQSNMEDFSDIAKSGMEQASLPISRSLNIWPFHTVPRLETWSSQAGRTIIVGDAAHAIPPTAGQGANQAFEDAYSLALILSSMSTTQANLKARLDAWQKYRQDRIQEVLVLSDQMNSLRLPAEQRKLLPPEKIWTDKSGDTGKDHYAWLYLHEIDKTINAIVANAP